MSTKKEVGGRVNGSGGAAPPVAANEGVLALLLAGGLRASPLRQHLNIPPLCLPLTPNAALIDEWLDAVRRAPSCAGLQVVVSSENDARAIKQYLSTSRVHEQMHFAVDVVVETAPWRGPAGLIRDMVRQRHGTSRRLVFVSEASCLPPHDIESIVRAVDKHSLGVSVADRNGEPAGAYVFTAEAIDLVPAVGFHDIKEQLLPLLYARGTPIPAARTGDEVYRLRDRASYLAAVRARAHTGNSEPDWATSKVSATAHLAGCCLLKNAVVEQGAVVHDSIVLDGATIGRGAVVSRSIVGPGVRIAAQSVVKRRTISNSKAADQMVRRSAAGGIPALPGLSMLFDRESVS